MLPLCRAPVACLVAAALLPVAAVADPNIRLSGISQYEYNSNVFVLPGPLPVPGTTDYQHSDNYYEYGAELHLDDAWSGQQFHADLLDSEYRYQHFSELTHNEYKLNGGLKWVWGVRFSGKLDVVRNRVLVPLTDVANSQPSLQTEQRESGSIAYQYSKLWTLEGTGLTHTLQEPLVQAPQLQLSETLGTLTLKYTGFAGLVSGLTVGYGHGDYSNTNGTFNPAYNQKTIALVANYTASGRSSFDGTVGYDRRNSVADSESFSGVTGRLAYTNHLTPKTSLSFALDRGIHNYISTASSEIDTAASATLTWRATYRIAPTLGYVYMYSAFPNQGFVPGTNRGDHYQYTSLKVDYVIRDWVKVQPFANVQNRSSNYPGYSFNATVFGVQLVVTAQK
jgi:hypothetical protein